MEGGLAVENEPFAGFVKSKSSMQSEFRRSVTSIDSKC